MFKFPQDFGIKTTLHLIQQVTAMENLTSAGSYEWEYYYDYIDPVIVDERKLKYNKCKYFFPKFILYIYGHYFG